MLGQLQRFEVKDQSGNFVKGAKVEILANDAGHSVLWATATDSGGNAKLDDSTMALIAQRALAAVGGDVTRGMAYYRISAPGKKVSQDLLSFSPQLTEVVLEEPGVHAMDRDVDYTWAWVGAGVLAVGLLIWAIKR